MAPRLRAREQLLLARAHELLRAAVRLLGLRTAHALPGRARLLPPEHGLRRREARIESLVLGAQRIEGGLLRVRVRVR